METITWTDFPASEEAEQYKDDVKKLFLSSGQSLHARRILLDSLPDGDWRDSKRVHVRRKAGANEATVAKDIAHGIAAALFGKKFDQYPESRWKGFEITQDQQGICDACHGLLTRTYRRFCKEHGDIQGPGRGV
eukprot:9358282-Pyramimonas_sp.AAC.1